MIPKPVLDAYDNFDEYWIWCDYCKKFHIHSPGDGPRECHCNDARSPYYETGYSLQRVGIVTGDMIEKQYRALFRRWMR